jgi:hypothetical protein
MNVFNLILTTLSASVIFVTHFAQAQQQNTQVNMSIYFNAQSCWQSDYNNVCTIGVNRDSFKIIPLEPLFYGCANPPSNGGSSGSIGPVPWSETTPSPLQPGEPNLGQCDPRNWRGHWIDLLYHDGKRYVGIVTVEKSLISMSSQPNMDKTWYTITVEILDMKKIVAKMSTSFENWDELPSAALESMPIEKGSTTTTISLNIGKAFEMIIAPSPSPIATPYPTPSPYPQPTNWPSPSSSSILQKSKSIWNVSKGQLSIK